MAHAESYPDLATQRGGLLSELGIYLVASAQFNAARATLERALAMKEAAYGPDHPEVAITLANLGIVQQQLGELPAARATPNAPWPSRRRPTGPTTPRSPNP